MGLPLGACYFRFDCVRLQLCAVGKGRNGQLLSRALDAFKRDCIGCYVADARWVLVDAMRNLIIPSQTKGNGCRRFFFCVLARKEIL